MNTQPGISRELSKSSSAVSAQHFFTCRANFILNVAPVFPAAKAFAPHFCDSYVLMKSLPAESKEPVPVGFGLLLLGVKSHEILPASFTAFIHRNIGTLTSLGLSFCIMESEKIEVFNSAAIGMQLNSILGKGLPITLRADLAKFEQLNAKNPASYPYELLDWPSLVSPNKEFSIWTMDTYSGTMRFPSKPNELLLNKELVYTAVAVVEQIMEKLKVRPRLSSFRIDSPAIQPVCDAA